MAKLQIAQSVGLGGVNTPKDIKAVQAALNQLLGLIPPTKKLAEDGKLGSKPENSKTVAAIKVFQKKVVGMVRPDGKIDVNGRSHRKINEKLFTGIANSPVITSLKFPLASKPTQSYKVAPRSFGSSRSSGSRKHAGCDLYADAGTEIYAMTDGVVKAHRKFYLGTYQLIVDHGSFIARYGEVDEALPDGIKVGDAVKKGQHIADVGLLTFKSGATMSMLHLEMYSGKASGALSDKSPNSNEYKRRSDLLDPTPYLDKAAL
ncbi:M23 family metallopeptidase [Agarivorans gilvus]|uniref:M23ase beta-sheet core domain-containing protein n=1 Tax=Agarivorans gilvus TaxID=680279 RepID=A0ABQ1I739_9ALTE|nr:M23 family metallopeptidase [Agarivorans gilvus]GGB21800.1 hypothetical protein GCM10007414_38980 [Agarivorans gilvus]